MGAPDERVNRSSVRHAHQFTVSVTVVLAVKAPLVPVIVKVTVPRMALFFTLTVIVEPMPVTTDGLKLMIVPSFIPVTDSDTGPVNPPVRFTVIANAVNLPCWTVCDAG